MEQTQRTNAQRPQNVRRRRRKKRRAPVKELAICAAIIFLAGFLLGFLVRSAFLPKDKTPSETTTAPVQTTEPKPQPPVPVEDWRLVLVNGSDPLPEGFTVSLTKLPNGQEIDKRCYSDLQAMLDACKAEGLDPILEDAYRTEEQQSELFEEQIRELRDQGVKPAEVEQKAALSVAAPGHSEHQLGLAVDIAGADAQQWLMEHSWEYGFLLRYPSDKTAQTGRDYAPGHYRYVGRDAAAEMWQAGLCLEEYLAQFE